MTASIPLRIYLQHQFSKVCALERTDGENSPYFVFNYPAETPPYQGFSALRFQTPHLISSQARYDHFDTLPDFVARAGKTGAIIIARKCPPVNRFLREKRKRRFPMRLSIG